MRQPCCFFVRSVSFHLSLTVIVCNQAPPFIKGRGWGGNVSIDNKKEQSLNCSFLLGYQDSNLE